MSRSLRVALSVGVTLLAGVFFSASAAQTGPQTAAQRQPPQRLQLVDHEHLPLSFARPLLLRAELAFHHLESLAYAYYEPPRPLVVADGEAAGGEVEVVLSAPRISLQRRYFKSSEVAFPELTIDLAENLSFALLLGHLHDQVELGSEYGLLLRERALATRTENEAPDDVVAAAMMAIASYGSHLLSLANEVERLRRRIEAGGGTDLCQLIAQRIGLLGLWERAFAGPFSGSAFDSSGREVVREVAEADKRLLVEKVFQGVWRGDAMADFGGRYCRR